MAEHQFIEPTEKDRLLCLNISKTSDNHERANDYERTRHYWRLNVNRARKAHYVLAVVHGIVKAVFKPTRWAKAEDWNGPTVRYEFEGTEIPDSPFLGLSVWNIVNPKNQNPVSYINM